MDYEIRQPFGRRPTIAFACPNCRAPLVAGLHDAGATERCPHCESSCTVPGRAEASRVIEQRIAASRRPLARASATAAGTMGAAADGQRGDEDAGLCGDPAPSGNPQAPRGTPEAIGDLQTRLAAVLEARRRSALARLAAWLRRLPRVLLSHVFLYPRNRAVPSHPRAARIESLRAQTAYPGLRTFIHVATLAIGASAIAAIAMIIVSSTVFHVGTRALLPRSLATAFVVIDLITAFLVWAIGALLVRLVYHGGNMLVDIPDLLLDVRDRTAINGGQRDAGPSTR